MNERANVFHDYLVTNKNFIIKNPHSMFEMKEKAIVGEFAVFDIVVVVINSRKVQKLERY